MRMPPYAHPVCSWTQVCTNDAENMTEMNSEPYVDFGSSGLWKHDGIRWTRISTGNAIGLRSYGNKVIAGFGTSGLYEYDGSTWSRISTANCEDMVGVNFNN